MCQGWKDWADDGYPYLDAANRDKYKFTSRGDDVMIPTSWEEAYRYIARGMIAIATHYSGEEGAARLQADNYPEEMIAAMQGAGTRTMKCHGGMSLLGVIGKYGMYRFSNTLALLDTHVHGTDAETALGGRRWSNYTWHGDQAPGHHPFTTGLQASDCDFNDLRNTRLHIQCGKNLVENKMAESHFFIETMERGGKIYTITPEYSPPATKADTWIPIRLHPHEIFPDYEPGLTNDGPSFKLHGLSQEQYDTLGDYVVFDENAGDIPLTRDDVGEKMDGKGINPRLSWSGKVTLLPSEEGTEGKEIEVMTLWAMYEEHLQEYDLDTVADITHAPKQLIEQMAKDIVTMSPVAIHIGEGINHWFHATLANRAQFLPVMLTGDIGKPGAGCYTWAGNYKAALFQGSPWTGPGFKGWIAEDPFHPDLSDTLDGKGVHAHSYAADEEPAYWNHGDRPLIVEIPKYGRRNFTGASHMPTPSKVLFHSNVNLLNNAKHHYDMIKNVNPIIDLIIAVDIEMTASVEYADFGLAANSWAEFETPEITASCSNPFLQIWKGGIPPLYDTKDDVMILGELAAAIGDEIGDSRFRDYWKFVLEGRPEVYIQRLLDMSVPTCGYTYDDIMSGKYGEPGSALMLFRTYPRIPFWKQVNDSEPFFTDCGRLAAYCDIPEAIEYGENIISHREGPEGTPYLPNVIVSSSRFIRPTITASPKRRWAGKSAPCVISPSHGRR